MTLTSPLAFEIAQLKNSGMTGRALHLDELARLREQGNLIDPSTVLLAGEGFDPARVHFNRFRGTVLLDGSVYRSVLEDVELSRDCEIDQCTLVRRTIVGKGALLRASSIDCSEGTTFGMGTAFKAGLETPGKGIVLWDSMTLPQSQSYLVDDELRTAVSLLVAETAYTRSVVCEGARIVDSHQLDCVYIGPFAQILGASKVTRCTIHSTAEEPVLVGTSAIVEDSLVQWGSTIDSGAQVRSSALLEHSGAQRQALVTDSLIGPNTEVGEGEVTASLLGPFIGLHHHSLLIATWWPQGRGNVGYGANVGSNHTSRAPDQELHVGEGTFFGLSTAIKFPSNFVEAPYSIIATGAVTLPQKLGMPFSLITSESALELEFRGLNRLQPAWVLMQNAYQLLRSEAKFLQRNRARRHQFDLRVLRPEIVEKLWKARGLLENMTGKAVYKRDELPELGSNFLREADRLVAIETYGKFFCYAALKLQYEQIIEDVPCDKSWLEGAFRRLERNSDSIVQNLNDYLSMELELWEAALASKVRDHKRGEQIIPDYASVHGSAESDSFLIRHRAIVEEKREKIRAKGIRVS